MPTVSQVQGCQSISKLSCRSLTLTSYKAFLKKQKEIWKKSWYSFSAWFLEKNNSVDVFYYLTKFQCLVAFTSWDIWQYEYCICFLTRLWRYKFWNWPDFSNHAFFLQDKKIKDKNLNILRIKLLRWDKKAFFIIFKGLSLGQIRGWYRKNIGATDFCKAKTNFSKTHNTL